MSKVLVRLMGGPADGQEWVAPEFRNEWLVPGVVSRRQLFRVGAEEPHPKAREVPVYAYTFNPRLGRWTYTEK